jgi:D-serine deaminase-like pyridoxal phosphate-dependent protein
MAAGSGFDPASVARTLTAFRMRRPWQPVPLDAPVPVEALPTPSLLVDVDQLERNLAHMASYLGARGTGVRAHAKMHKSPIIALRQLELGAVGICAAKLAEAETLHAAGVEDILLTSPVTTPDRFVRLAALAALSPGRVWTVVDDADMARALAAAAAAVGARIDVLIDVDPDMGRTGVRGAEGVLALAAELASMPALRLRGIQQYAGQVMHIRDHAERKARSEAHWASGLAIVDRLRASGFPVEIVTGGGTGTFDIDAEIAGITDLQVGSYAFMDEEYLQIEGAGTPRFEAFPPSLFVLASVVSRPRSGAVTLDAGLKSFASETVAPVPVSHPGTRFRFAGDEHGILILDGQNAAPALGERVRLVTSHCDPTVNLYDVMYPVRDGMVSELWPIAARGAAY